MRLFGFFRKNKQRQSFAETTQNRIRYATTALFRDITLHIQTQYRMEQTSAARIAGTVINLITGQHNEKAFEGRTPDELALAEQLAVEIVKDREYAIRASHIGMCWCVYLQELSTQDDESDRGLVAESISVAEKALENMPGDATLLALLAKSYYLIGAYDEAMKRANEAIEAGPYDFNGYLQRGLIAAAMGGYQLAESSFKAAIALEPNLRGVPEMLRELEAASLH